jgi:hypothetical protein
MVGHACIWKAFNHVAAGYREAEKTALFAGTACDVYRLPRGTE